MARQATTTDAFNAVAEPQRRRILELLVSGERSVGEIAELLDLRQPQVSKHLAVLKHVGLVSVRGAAQQRLYQLNPAGLKPVGDGVKPFERLWEERLDRFQAYVEQLRQHSSPTQEATHEPGE